MPASWCWRRPPGRVDLDVVSLFPEHTWKNRRNGLRADLVADARRPAPGVHAFSRRLHRRGHGPAEPLPVEGHDRRHRRASGELEPLAGRDARPDRAAVLPDLRPRFLRVLPALRGHRRRAAADPQLRHGLPVPEQATRAARPARSVRAGRARPDRVRQRPGDERRGARSARRWAIRSRST